MFAQMDPHGPGNGFATQFRSGGSYLGIHLLEIDANRARALKLPDERGVEIAAVEEDSPAEHAGLRKGDVVINYNGENVLGAEQFIRLVQETPAGRKVKMQVWREGKAEWLVATTAAPKPWFTVPPNFVNFSTPSVNTFIFPDIPNPLLVWKNSFLGIECESVDSQLAQYFGVKHGLLVRSVDRGSAGEKAGMRAGDVLVAFGDRTLISPHDMSSYIRSEHQAGRSVSVSLVRDHKTLTLTVAPP
ncbi:MAG: PDZ domain-containing protein, partial [Acidobacteriaceae bacterium]|nr:PDZ domain-containing protein [Acidobacteriaceae bacterium]